MRSDDAIDRLLSLLREAGVDLDQPSAADVTVAWQVFGQFAAERVEDCEPPEQDGDGILAQYGTYDWGTGEHFELDMTRQFTFVDENGDYDHMAQLNCTFEFEPLEELKATSSASEWSFGRPVEDFFEEALANLLRSQR